MGQFPDFGRNIAKACTLFTNTGRRPSRNDADDNGLPCVCVCRPAFGVAILLFRRLAPRLVLGLRLGRRPGPYWKQTGSMMEAYVVGCLATGPISCERDIMPQRREMRIKRTRPNFLIQRPSRNKVNLGTTQHAKYINLPRFMLY